MHIFPKRAPLQELGGEIFKLVSYSATPEQWAEWLRVPLEHAVARGNLDLVNTLLEAGADGGAGWRGCRGRTLLDAAAVGGNPDVVTALLGAGAPPDVNVVSLSPARSALYVATVCGHADVARRLVLAGADVRFEDPVDHCTVLHEAACGGHEQLVNDLLIGGADPNFFVKEYGTPLHQAAMAGHAGIVSALLLRGANIDALGQDGEPPLALAAWTDRLAAVKTLLAAGADYNIRDIDEESVLDGAARQGHTPVIKAILGYGADVNSRDSVGYSALHKAAMHNQAGSIDCLIDAGADVEFESNAGKTPLCKAAIFGNVESILTLLKRGAAVMARDEGDYTPLHWACSMKNPGLEMAVGILLRWGADENAATSTHNNTPADGLNFEPHGNYARCSQEEVERARLLLARAPADRAWRRRGWLVMLRSRASKAEVASRGNGGNSDSSSGDCSNVGGTREGERPNIARMGAAAGLQHDSRGQRSSSGVGEGGGLLGVGAGGGAEASSSLNGIVALLLGLELEGVFRSVVGFL